MLNFDIKKKINSLRDILVGKVPDPKAQVEQITIALIYKFMDDMDIKGVRFGATREFFKKDYEKYAWTNIMQSENSGQQKAILYSEGIDKMSTNPNLPQLFRDIFRGAYVPYRDPETLTMFLKEINDFNYDHSEELGNAFEYLLSIMGSQGDAGQFRTPRHIIDMMVEIVDPKKTESILDPACGTAGFLISSYKHILENNLDADGNSALSSDDRKRMTKNFVGYDISPDMVRLSRVNMYLHQFAKPKIYEYDTLTSLERWDDSFDVILANPPFMSPKGGIIPHNRYRVNAKRSEVLFVDYIAEHLNPTGRAGIIVPEGIVFQSGNAYKALRKYLVDDGLLFAVVSLPTGVFNPYSGVKTSILLFDKTIAKQKDEILFIKIGNDGYDLGAQRRELNNSDIPEAIRIVKDYMVGKDVSDSTLVTLAKKRDIAKQDYILVGDRYKATEVVNSDWPMVELGEICTFESGSRQKGGSIANGVPSIGGEQISRNGKLRFEKMKYISDEHFDQMKKGILKKDDVLIVKDGATTGKMAYYEGDYEKAAVNEHVFILRANNRLLPFYLYNILNSERFYSLLQRYIKGIIGGISLEIKEMKIPLPPLNIQEEIVKEIGGYQKIIDGARQVVENYKPTIKIDPSWEIVKLGDVFEIQAGGTPLKSNNEYWESNDVAWYTSGELNYVYTIDPVKYISNQGLEKSSARIFPKGSLLIGMYDTAAFKMSILDRDAAFNQAVCGVKPSPKFDMLFLMIYFSSKKEDYLKMRVGARQRNLTKQFISELLVPAPPLLIQKELTEKIVLEMSIIEQNKNLVSIFEEKIRNKISEVWGN